MASIQLKTKGRIENVNVRVEGSAAEGTQIPALDVKFKASAPASALGPLLGCGETEAARFWIDGGRIPAFPHLGEIRSSAIFENCNVQIASRKFQAAKLRGVLFTVREDHVLDITFTISLSGLTEKGSGFFCGLYHADVAIDLESAQVDAFDEGGDDGEI